MTYWRVAGPHAYQADVLILTVLCEDCLEDFEEETQTARAMGDSKGVQCASCGETCR